MGISGDPLLREKAWVLPHAHVHYMATVGLNTGLDSSDV